MTHSVVVRSAFILIVMNCKLRSSFARCFYSKHLRCILSVYVFLRNWTVTLLLQAPCSFRRIEELCLMGLLEVDIYIIPGCFYTSCPLNHKHSLNLHKEKDWPGLLCKNKFTYLYLLKMSIWICFLSSHDAIAELCEGWAMFCSIIVAVPPVFFTAV